MPGPSLTFPLEAKRRLVGLAYGVLRSSRRGLGSDVAGARPYRPGDSPRLIDWAASAKLSRARGGDEFVVREHYADEAPRVVVLCDRRPSMSLYPEGWPWLEKPRAVGAIVQLVAESALAAQAYAGYLDHATGDPFWRPPTTQRTLRGLELGRPSARPRMHWHGASRSSSGIRATCRRGPSCSSSLTSSSRRRATSGCARSHVVGT